jgi:tetratricopeptide (TPR) repeat protein
MLKYQPLIATALGVLLVVPAATLGQGEIETLEQALRGTLRGLEVLRALDARARQQGPPAPGEVLRLTEPALEDQRGRDERLGQLRNEVSLLQTEADLLESLDPESSAQALAALGSHSAASALPEVSIGLDEATRQLISSLDAPATDPAHASGNSANAADPRQGGAQAAPATSTRPSPVPSYSAAPLLHAQALYKAARYEDALEVYMQAGEQTSVWYGTARCLEALGRIDDAIEALQRVVTTAPDTHEGARAKTDLEFLQWKQSFLQRLPKGAAKGGGSR